MSNVRQLLREIAQVPKISWVQDIDRRWWAIFGNGDRVYLAEPTKLHETFNRIRLGSLQKSVRLNTVV